MWFHPLHHELNARVFVASFCNNFGWIIFLFVLTACEIWRILSRTLQRYKTLSRKLSTIVAKLSILDACGAPGYAPGWLDILHFHFSSASRFSVYLIKNQFDIRSKSFGDFSYFRTTSNSPQVLICSNRCIFVVILRQI